MAGTIAFIMSQPKQDNNYENITPKIHSDLLVNSLNETYQAGKIVDFQIEAKGFDYFDGGAVPDVKIKKPDGTVVWTNPPQYIILCCPVELVDYDKKFNYTNLERPLIINQTGSYKLVVSYNGKTAEKEFSVIPSSNMMHVTNTDFTVNYTITGDENKLFTILFGKIPDNYTSNPFSLHLRVYVANPIDTIPAEVIKVNQPYQVIAQVTRQDNQPLIYYYCIVQVQNEKGIDIADGWNQETLIPNQSSSECAIRWVPNSIGNYTISAFAWQDLNGTPKAEPAIENVQVLR